VKIAIASGKGGTGKTMVATNLAIAAADTGAQVQLLDCDVEEPDCALFLEPVVSRTSPVELLVPEVDETLCNHCGVCSDVCAFKAIAALPSSVLVFPELCHSCGACSLLCPRQALTETPRRTGVVQIGRVGRVRTVSGQLDVGEAKAVPVIRAVRDHVDPTADLVLIDSPPGSSCPVIEAVRDADIVVLVTEPTPFGLHDLRLAVATVRRLGLPLAVILNRSDIGDHRVASYCDEEGLEIVLDLPHDARLAEAYSFGLCAVDHLPGYRERFLALLERLDALVAHGSGVPR